VLLYVTLVSSGCQAWAAGRTGRRIFTAVPVELLSDCRDPSSLARGLCAHLKSPASLPNSLHSPVLPFPTGPRGSDGHAGGFVEWGKAGKPPLTYLADGWARQRESVAPPITVFELALHYVEVPGSQGPTPARGRLTPLTVRVVVDETSPGFLRSLYHRLG
jgi:hypothetical protein